MSDSTSPPGVRSCPDVRLRVVHRRPRPGVAVVLPVGEMDAVGAPTVTDRLRDLAPSCTFLVLDMRRVGFLDAGGIHALLEGSRAARQHAARLLIVGLDPAFHRVLRICGVESELTLTDASEAERRARIALPRDDGTAGDTTPVDPAAGGPGAGD